MTSLQCDILVIGSGAAGSVLAATLSELTNKKIILVEKGGYFGAESFNQREWDMRVLYAEQGRRATADGAIPVRGGQCAGGGTTVNFALCLDPVPAVWDRWKRERGLVNFSFDPAAGDYGVPGLNMPNCLNEVRHRLNVHPASDEDLNDNNRLFEQGCRALNVKTKRFPLNMRDCLRCGYCAEGCAYDRKQGTMITYLQDALDRGVKLIHHCDIDRIEIGKKNGGMSAVGAVGRIRRTRRGSRPNSVPPGRVHIRSHLVAIACGAIETPLLLERSHHPDPHRRIGKGLVLHPSLPIIGVMNSPLTNYRGISGSVYSDHYAETHGFYFECLFGHPMYGAAVLPNTGTEHFELMLEINRLAGFGVMLEDRSDDANRVESSPEEPWYRIHYQLGEDEKSRLRFAAEKAVEVMFAAGAREVLLPSDERLGSLPSPRFRRPADARFCSELQFTPHRTTITSSHCQATAKMGLDPRRSVINSRCESHLVRNLLVCDSSSFPESCGANPMLSIMTLARYQAKRIAAELPRYGL